MKVGDKFNIHCYKHDGKIHRTWDEAVLLEIHKDYIICGNNRTKVTEADGRSHRTKEPAVMYFFTNRWFNIIGQLKSQGLYYYCNIASPFVIEDHTIKYIDYDLDLRIFPDGSFKILDKSEYNYHRKKMEYSQELDCVVRQELNSLIDLYKKKKTPFQDGIIEYYHSIYNGLQKK